MTVPAATPRQSTRMSAAFAADRTEDALRAAGREISALLQAASRSVRLYPASNPQVTRTIDEFTTAVRLIYTADERFDLRVAGDFVFINDLRLRLERDETSAIEFVRTYLWESGVDGIGLTAAASAADWRNLLVLLNTPQGKQAGDRFLHLERRLAAAEVQVFAIRPASLGEGGAGGGDAGALATALAAARAEAGFAYGAATVTIRSALEALRGDRTPRVSTIKRAVQRLLDQVLANEAAMLGLVTAGEDTDEIASHMVAVAILSIGLGRYLGLRRDQLYDLGFAALLHNLGMMRMPADLLHKPGKLTPDERAVIESHTWLGVIALFNLRERGQFPYRAMLAAYEHHMRQTAGGYPRPGRHQPGSFYARIIAIADRYSAAVSLRSYHAPRCPAGVAQEFLAEAHQMVDPALAFALAAYLGPYPPGTCVLLASGELALVRWRHGDAGRAEQPLALLIGDTQGRLVFPGTPVDLADPAAIAADRRIVRVVSAWDLGIRTRDHFV
jgi:HD-GYP domain-containing protein (c-di-GMP phosphodiesterase class II)